jgi:hypothetical protein
MNCLKQSDQVHARGDGQWITEENGELSTIDNAVDG